MSTRLFRDGYHLFDDDRLWLSRAVALALADGGRWVDARVKEIFAARADGMQAAEARGLDISHPLTAGAQTQDALNAEFLLALTLAVTAAESHTTAAGKALADSTGMAEAFRVAVAKLFAESVTTADAHQQHPALAFTDGAQLTDLWLPAFWLYLAETVSAAEARAQAVARAQADGARGTDGSFVSSFAKRLTAPVGASEARALQPDKVLTEGAQWQDAVAHAVALALAEAVKYAEAGGAPYTILDDANRPNVGPPPSAQWANWQSDGILVDSHAFRGENPFAYNADYWLELFDPDQAVYVAVTDLQTDDGEHLSVIARLNPATGDYYLLEAVFYLPDNAQLNLWRYDAGAATLLAQYDPLPRFTKFGLVADSTTLGAWYYDGAWVLAGTQTDATHASGYIGLRLDTAVSTAHPLADDFGGGSLGAGTTLIKHVYKVLADLFAGTDALLTTAGVSLTEGVTALESLVKSVVCALADSALATELLGIARALFLYDGAQAADSLAAVVVLLLTLWERTRQLSLNDRETALSLWARLSDALTLQDRATALELLGRLTQLTLPEVRNQW